MERPTRSVGGTGGARRQLWDLLRGQSKVNLDAVTFRRKSFVTIAKPGLSRDGSSAFESIANAPSSLRSIQSSSIDTASAIGAPLAWSGGRESLVNTASAHLSGPDSDG